MNLERRVETADSGAGRVTAAAASLAKWYRFENIRLASERRLARQEIDAGTSDRGEMERLLVENAEEQRQLHVGWERSTLRQEVEKRASLIDMVERRTALGLSSAPPTLRATETSSAVTARSISGYAAKFNVLGQGPGFVEKIQRGAFAKAIKTCDIRCLFNHNPDHLFGRMSAMTLEIAEDSVGLRFVCHLLPWDSSSYSLARHIDRKDIQGCSFSFVASEDSWKFRPGEQDERTIETIEQVWDVGPVTYPFYPQTSVTAVFAKVERSAVHDDEAMTKSVESPEPDDRGAFYDELDEIDEQIKVSRNRAIRDDYDAAGRVLNRMEHQLWA